MIFIDESKHKNYFGVYMIRQISNDRVYIGQTGVKFVKRFWHHAWKLKDNSHDNRFLQSAWNKYGEADFEFKVIHISKEDEGLNELEMNYIAKYNSYENGFNMTIGGEGKRRCSLSEEAKKRIGEKNRVHNLGKKHSAETRKRMSDSSLRRKMTKEHRDLLTRIRTGSKHTEEAKKKMREKKLGENNVGAVINSMQAVEIKERLISGESMAGISNDMNISYPIVRTIIEEKAWTHIDVDGWIEFRERYEKTKKKLLDRESVLKIRSLIKEGYTTKKISDELKVGYSVVDGIRQNRTYKDIV